MLVSMNKKVILTGFVLLAGYVVLRTVDGREKQKSKRNIELQMNRIKKQKQKSNIEALEAYIEKAGIIQNKDVVNLLGVSEKTARNYCAQLVTSGVARKNGATGRSVYYRYTK